MRLGFYSTSRYVQFFSSNSNQHNCVRRRNKAELHQERTCYCCYSCNANPPHRSGIEMAELPQRRIVLCSLLGDAAQNDMVQHVDLQ